MADTHRDDVNELISAAVPEMGPETKERTLDKMLAVHPRRPRRTLLWVIGSLIALPLLLGAAVASGMLSSPDEGTLYYRGARGFGPGQSWDHIFKFLTGQANPEPAMPSSDSDPSPVSDEIVWATNLTPELHPTHWDIMIRRSDGTDFNLTQAAGIGGLNCSPKWSPDGTMIAFQHCNAVGDKPACKDGFAVWIVNADGSDAHPLFPEGAPNSMHPVWHPDGRHLLLELEGEEGVMVANLEGTEVWPLPNVGGDPVFSPDGSMIASSVTVRDEVEGSPGVWRQLVITDAEGNDPRVLVEQFIADADIEGRYPTQEQQLGDPEMDWVADLHCWVGPGKPQWSPRGDKIAFLAALPFDPEGPYYRDQVQVWIYDLRNDELTQVTDQGGHYGLVWRRPVE